MLPLCIYASNKTTSTYWNNKTIDSLDFTYDNVLVFAYIQHTFFLCKVKLDEQLSYLRGSFISYHQAQSPNRHYHLESVKPHVDPYEQEMKVAAENKLILERFSKAWQPPVKILIIDLSVVNYVDTVAVKTFASVSMAYFSFI